MLNNLAIGDLVIVFGAILLSMAIHEAVHAFTAHALGDTTAKDEGRLTLNPLKHIDLYTTVLLPIILILIGVPPFFAAKPVPFNPTRVKFDEFGAALVGVAGPLTNFVLAAIAALIIRISGVAVGTDMFHILSIFVVVNLGFFVFNMIPFPPLDGSRLLYAFAPEPVQRVMYQIESMGFTAILLFMLAFIYLGAGSIVVSIVDAIYNFLLQ